MMKIQEGYTERHVLTITVDNEAGILAKIKSWSEAGHDKAAQAGPARLAGAR